MSPLDILSAQNLRIQEYTLGSEENFWHSSIINQEGEPISGGFGATKEHSRKIAFAEYLERTAYGNIFRSRDKLRKKWGLDLIPTGCGFAAGFDQKNTEARSIGEALERWVMSKWIDDGYQIEDVTDKIKTESLSNASKWILTQFAKVMFFRKTVVVKAKDEFLKYDIGFTVALTSNGAFPGSSAQYRKGDIWEHALIESFRHLLIYKNTPSTNSFPDNRVRYFAENVQTALDSIKRAKLENWPTPQISFQYSEGINEDEFFLSRTIIGGWRSWHEGSVERFVY